MQNGIRQILGPVRRLRVDGSEAGIATSARASFLVPTTRSNMILPA